MCSNKSDENMSDCEFYYYYQSILISSNIKHIMLVAYIICCGKVNFYI